MTTTIQHLTDLALAAALAKTWDADVWATGRERPGDTLTTFDFRLTGSRRCDGGVLVVTVTIGCQSPVTYVRYAEQALRPEHVIAAFPRFTWATLDKLAITRQRLLDEPEARA